MEVIKEILDTLGVDGVESMSINEFYTVEVAGFEDLSIEKIGENRLSVEQHYVQRMDRMSDPEIVFRVDGDEWTPVRFTQHPAVHKHDEDGLDLDGFPAQWSENLRKQGFLDAAQARAGAEV